MNRTPPEGVPTVTGEGELLAAAVLDAAKKLGVNPESVVHILDRSWFRSATGAVIPRDTVRIVAWAQDPVEQEALHDARAWLQTVLEGMEIQATVTGKITSDKAVHLLVDADQAGRIIGKQGATLKAIRHLLMQSVGADHQEHEFFIDVADRRPREEEGRGEGGWERGPRRDGPRGDDRGPRRDGPRGDDRGPRRDGSRDDRGPRRDDRGPRGDGARRDDRGPRRDGRGRGEGRGEGRGGDAEQAALRQLAQKLAAKVLRSGQPEVIRRELNSFDRRLVHVTISEIEGVGTRSIGEGSHKQVEIFRSGGAEE